MNKKIYEIPNPFWLADKFIFSEVNGNLCYIKVNHVDKIEEVGKDFVKRFHYTQFNEILNMKTCREASKKHEKMFNMFNWAEL
jgi:hypothetical protein